MGFWGCWSRVSFLRVLGSMDLGSRGLEFRGLGFPLRVWGSWVSI